MKTFRKIGYALVAVLACACATSCGSDDDDNEEGLGGGAGASSGKITATVGGEKLTLTNGYWYFDETSTASSGKKFVSIEFYNFDITSQNVAALPSSMNYLSISYEVPESATTLNSITVEAGDYDVYVVKGMPFNGTGYGWQAENFWNDRSGSPLVVTRDGDKYTIKIDNIAVGQEDESSAKTLKFQYSGTLKLMPEGFQD